MLIPRDQRGFSLIDLMVGLVISLLVAMAVFSSTNFLTAQRRTSMSGDSALENGLAGLYAIQQDVKSAGIGIWFTGQPVCPSINIYNGGVVADSLRIAPVVITPGATPKDADRIAIFTTSSIMGAARVPLLTAMPTAADELTAQMNTVIQKNDLVLVATLGSSAPCTLMQVTNIQNTGVSSIVQHSSAGSSWNPASPNTAYSNAPAYPAGSVIFDVGQVAWTTYQINNGNLEAVNGAAIAGVPGSIVTIAENVVMLKAYYGTSNGATSQIDQWVPATGLWAAPLDPLHISEIRAARLAVVVRSPHPEKPSVKGGACDTTTIAPASWVGGPGVDLSSDPNWKCYRYKTYSLVMPLKNMLFGSMTL